MTAQQCQDYCFGDESCLGINYNEINGSCDFQISSSINSNDNDDKTEEEHVQSEEIYVSKKICQQRGNQKESILGNRSILRHHQFRRI